MMEEEKRGGGGDSSSRASSSFVKSGDRQMFTVDLRPGETTIVSWKKLMKDANKVNGSSSASVPEPPVNAYPGLESRIAPVRPSNPIFMVICCVLLMRFWYLAFGYCEV